MPKDKDWIVCHDGTKGDDAYAIECLRCGKKQRFSIPIAVPVYLAAIKEFGKIHSKCKE